MTENQLPYQTSKNQAYISTADQLTALQQTEIIKLRKQFLSARDISSKTNTPSKTINKFCDNYFQNNDPYWNYVCKCYNDGEGSIQLAKRLNEDRNTITAKFNNGYKNKLSTGVRDKIIQEREKLKSISAIHKVIGGSYSSPFIANVLRFHYADKPDPFIEHIKNEFEKGRALYDIAKELKCNGKYAAQQLKKASPELYARHIEQVEEKKKKKAKKKIKHNTEQYAKDLYCYIQDGMSIRDLTIQEGIKTESNISTLFKKYIDGYTDLIKAKRENSIKCTSYNRSKKYRFENEFETHIYNQINNNLEYVIMQHDDMPKKLFCQPDFIIIVGKSIIVLELKVAATKSEINTAIGQCCSYKLDDKLTKRYDNIVTAIVLPDDLKMKRQHQIICEGMGIIFIQENNIIDKIKDICKSLI